MASPQAAAIDELFDSFLAALADNPEMGLDELRDMLEKCGDLARVIEVKEAHAATIETRVPDHFEFLRQRPLKSVRTPALHCPQ